MTARTVYCYIDSDQFAGAERALLTLLEGLDQRRWHATLVHHPAPGIAPLVDGARAAGADTWSVPPMPHGLAGAWRALSFARRLRRRRPDVFHAHLTWPLGAKNALVAALLARHPAVVATAHLHMDVRVTRPMRLQQRLIGLGADGLIAVSSATARGFADLGWPEGRIAVIPNGVAMGGPADGASHEPPRVLVTARLDPQKGHRHLLAAAREVPDAVFALAGDGPERPHLQALARELGIADRVRFLGVRDDVPALLASSDVVVLPSLYEGLPVSVLEAMAAARPVVATAIDGTRDVIADGVSGVLVPPADPAALAAAIRRLLADPALRERLGAAALDRVERDFSAAAMVARISDVYDRVARDDTNRRLRRVDWRFLAGRPDPRRVLAPRSGALATAVRGIAGDVATAGEPGTFDLAVLRNPGRTALRRAFAALEPGGACYVEWWRPAPRARRALEAAGFVDVALYWPWPAPLRRLPSFWVPLDDRGPGRWLLRRRRSSAATAWRILSRYLAPVCAVARRPGDGSTLAGALAAEPTAWGLNGTPPSCLLLTGGRAAHNKVVALPFAGAEPAVAIKIARVPAAEPGLRREAAALAGLQMPGVPQLVRHAPLAGTDALAETVIDGRPIAELLTPETHAALAVRVTDFLVALASPGPQVCEQRDLSPWNVLVRPDGTLAVLDWESAEPHGRPGLDLIYYLAYASFFVDRTIGTGREPTSYIAMLDPGTPTGRVYALCTTRYAERVGLAGGVTAAMRLQCWLTHDHATADPLVRRLARLEADRQAAA